MLRADGAAPIYFRHECNVLTRRRLKKARRRHWLVAVGGPLPDGCANAFRRPQQINKVNAPAPASRRTSLRKVHPEPCTACRGENRRHQTLSAVLQNMFRVATERHSLIHRRFSNFNHRYLLVYFLEPNKHFDINRIIELEGSLFFRERFFLLTGNRALFLSLLNVGIEFTIN